MKAEELFEIIDGIDDDIILDIPHLNAEKPTKIVVKSKRTPFWSYVGMAAGLVCVLAIGIFAAAKLQGSQPIGPGTSGTTFSQNNSYESNSNSENVSNNSEIPSKPFYDDVFKGINSDPLNTGAPLSYDEVMEMITSPLQQESGLYLDSFYIAETIRALSDEEAKKLNGWTELCEGRTIYEVRLLTDLISGKEVDRIEKILVAHGTKEWQKAGDPIYAPGEKFTVALTKPQEGCDYLHTPSSITFRYDVADDESGIILYSTLYSRGSEIDKLALHDSKDIDEEIITSTTQNPAVHTQKVEIYDLISYLRSDWKQRRVSTHYENEPITVDLGNGMTLTGTPLDKSELEEFTLEPYVSDYIMEKAEEEFLDSLEIPELKDLYKRATRLTWYRLSPVDINCAPAIYANDRVHPYIEGTVRYYEMGYTYESFYNEYLRTFTEETIDEVFKVHGYDVFLNYNGELFSSDGAMGGWLGEVHQEFELISKSDTVIEFKRLTFHHDSDDKPATEWIPELRNEYGIGVTEFKFVLTEDGWRAANIPVENKAEI